MVGRMRKPVRIAAFLAVALVVGGGAGAKGAQGSGNGPIAVWRESVLGTGIYRVDPDGSHLQQLTKAPIGPEDLPAWRDSSPAWAPDGKTIAFIRTTGAGNAQVHRLYVVKATGGGVHAVPGVALPFDDSLSWSPDGKRILFVGKGGLWTVSPSGAEPKLLVSSKYADAPSWSPDGKTIAFVQAPDIFLADSAGTHVRRLTHATRPLLEELNPTWSPDSKRLAYVQQDLAKIDTFPFRDPIKIVNADGSGARTIVTLSARPSDAPTWSPDGRLIAFDDIRGGKSGIYSISVGGGKPQLVLDGHFYEPDWGPAAAK